MSYENKLSKLDEQQFAGSLKAFKQMEEKSSFVQAGGIYLDAGKVVKVVKNPGSKQ